MCLTELKDTNGLTQGWACRHAVCLDCQKAVQNVMQGVLSFVQGQGSRHVRREDAVVTANAVLVAQRVKTDA